MVAAMENTMLDRRALLLTLTAAPALLGSVAARAAPNGPDLNSRMAALEKRSGGRLGVAALDLKTGQRLAWRADQRFRMCSTFKMPLAAHVLRRVDQGREDLNRKVSYGKAVLTSNSPVTEKHVADGLTVRQLCEAVITRSDNAGANLLLDAVGGPKALTRFLRAVDDQVTRCDRRELELNFGAADDPRDTTTPEAILATWRTLLLGDALSKPSRAQLTDWLVANRTGDKRLRAGLPPGWRVGDKTGNDGKSITNDIAIAWPARDRPPILIAAFLDRSSPDDDFRSSVHADLARILVAGGFGA
jgi:beta-lactamase class A